MLGLIIFPILFFMVGFLFKVFRPYYKPVEFVIFNMIASVIALVVANGATLFVNMVYFVQMALLHVVVYLIFSFVGLGTYNLYDWLKNKFPMFGGITRVITMLALISVMVTVCFSVQYVLTLIY